MSNDKRIRVKMLRRHCGLIPGAAYNLPTGELLDFLLSHGIAVVLLPAGVASAVPGQPSEFKVIEPAETKGTIAQLDELVTTRLQKSRKKPAKK